MRSSLVLLLATLACGGGGSSSTNLPTGPNNPPNNPSGAASATVTMKSQTDIYGYQDFSFDPANVAIAVNGSVTWSNGTATAHNVTFASASGAPTNIGDHTSGSNSRTFSTAGTFNYACTNHPSMTGQVVVQ